MADVWVERLGVSRPVTQSSNSDLQMLAGSLTNWQFTPAGTSGFVKAEVTVGGVDTNELSSKTMESKKVRGLYFIGEVVDVTGWLGGYNFQWAWSSGWAAGQVV
jgi:predicted Rossmann fold flavoprotein